jgi:hypothetical protein
MGTFTPKRTPEQRRLDIIATCRMRSKGVDWPDIARKLCEGKGYTLTRQAVYKDYMAEVAKRNAEMSEEVGRSVAITIMQLDHLIKECWDGYERSKRDRASRRHPIGKDGNPDRTTGTFEQSLSDGDPAWLGRIESLIQRKVALLGVEPPVKHALVGPNGQLTGAGAVLVLPSNGFELEVAKLKGNDASVIDVGGAEAEADAGDATGAEGAQATVADAPAETDGGDGPSTWAAEGISQHPG